MLTSKYGNHERIYYIKISLLLIAILGLAVSLFEMQTEYYDILRIYVTLVCIYMIREHNVYNMLFVESLKWVTSSSTSYYEPFKESVYKTREQRLFSIPFYVLLFAFNPIAKISFYEKAIWDLLDVFGIIFFAYAVLFETRINKDIYCSAIKILSSNHPLGVEVNETIALKALKLGNKYKDIFLNSEVDLNKGDDWYIEMSCEFYSISIYINSLVDQKSENIDAKYYRYVGNFLCHKDAINFSIWNTYKDLLLQKELEHKIHIVCAIVFIKFASLSERDGSSLIEFSKELLSKHVAIFGESALSHILMALCIINQLGDKELVEKEIRLAKSYMDYDEEIYSKIKYEFYEGRMLVNGSWKKVLRPLPVQSNGVLTEIIKNIRY